MWVGSHKNKQYGSEEISWIKKDENIKILGIFFSTKAEASNIPENWTAKIEDIQLTVQRWSKRNLSLAGKVLIAKTFLLSKLNYIIQALSLPKAIAAQIDSIIFKFLWQKKHSNKKAFEKIKGNNICKEVSDGGLGAISIVDQQTAFKIKWFKRGCTAIVEDSAHGKILSRLCKSMVSLTYLTRASVNSKEVKEVAAIQSDFWRSVVKGWLDFDKRSIMEDPENENDTRKQPLFNNTQVRYKSKPLFID